MTVLLSYSMISYLFLTFDGSIVTLGNTNITFDRTFFFSHLIVPSSNFAVLTSYITVLLSHLVVPFSFLFFPYI